MKIGFLNRVLLAITDFRFYPFAVQQEKLIKAFAYFVKLMLVVSLIVTFKYMPTVIDFTRDIEALISSDEVSDFTIADGKLDFENNIDASYNGIHIYADEESTISEEDLKLHVKDRDSLTIVMYNDCVAIGEENFGFVILNFEDIERKFTKQDVIQMLHELNTKNVYQVLLGVVVFAGIFASYIIIKLFNLLEITILMMLLGLIVKSKYNFKDYMKAACYVITLPMIIETVAILIVGNVNTIAYYTYLLLMYVYMYYAVRALKLTDVIMDVQEKFFSLKIEKKEGSSDKQENSSETNQEEKHEDSSETNQKEQHEENDTSKDDNKEDKQ